MEVRQAEAPFHTCHLSGNCRLSFPLSQCEVESLQNLLDTLWKSYTEAELPPHGKKAAVHLESRPALKLTHGPTLGYFKDSKEWVRGTMEQVTEGTISTIGGTRGTREPTRCLRRRLRTTAQRRSAQPL